MLELRRQLLVARYRGPAVAQDLHLPGADVHHRLDGEEHTGLQHRPGAGLAVVQDVRRIVEDAAQAMAREVAHDGEALALDIGLDGVADVADMGTRLYHR